MAKTRILIAEDEAITAKDLQMTLQDLGYEVTGTASSGEEAIQKAEDHKPALVLMDIVLQGKMDGIEAASQIHARLDVPIVYLTAHSDKATLERAKITEPFGYILKPFEERELHTNIEIALYKHKTERKLKENYIQLQSTFATIVDAMVKMIKVGAPVVDNHQQKVTQLSCAIAQEMEIPEDQAEGIRLASRIHDIGLLGIPSHILCTPKELRKDEFLLYSSHTKIGFDILKDISFPSPIATMALQHHEMMDGSGFPAGLKEKDIFFGSKILSLANAVTVMIFGRFNLPPITAGEAMEKIKAGKGVQYNAQVVDACVKLFAEKGFRFDTVV